MFSASFDSQHATGTLDDLIKKRSDFVLRPNRLAEWQITRFD